MIRQATRCRLLISLLICLEATIQAQSDTTPPRLLSFNISPTTVNVSKGPATLNVRISASDDLSGFGSGSTGNGYIDIRLPSGSSPFGRGSLPLTGGTTLNPIFEFTLTVPQYYPSGLYPISLALIDNVFNTLRLSSSDLQARGFPSVITVTSDPTPVAYSAWTAIPHIATGEGWHTTVRTSGSCTGGCSLEVKTLDNSGIVQNTMTQDLPASTSRWARTFAIPYTVKLQTGWIEVKATSQQAVSLCASALFTNSESKQEASSGSTCAQQSGYLTGAIGSIQYFYSHVGSYRSGIALLNTAPMPLSVLLQWRDELDTVIASLTIPLASRQQVSFTSNEASEKFGRFLVLPDPLMSPAQKSQFATSIYSLGFQFSPFGSFTQLSTID